MNTKTKMFRIILYKLDKLRFPYNWFGYTRIEVVNNGFSYRVTKVDYPIDKRTMPYYLVRFFGVEVRITHINIWKKSNDKKN